MSSFEPAKGVTLKRPYMGMEPYHYEDHLIFSGRVSEMEKLLQYVTIYRGVLLYGVSGAGKSSLINAGLVPRAIAEGFSPEVIRVQPRSGQELIVDRIRRAGRGESDYLPSILPQAEDDNSRIVLSVGQFRDCLSGLDEDLSPLLIFDQFEEFISLFEEAPPTGSLKAAAEAQENILRLLVDLTRDSSLPVKLLYVFREDYLAKLGKLFVHIPQLPDTYLRLTPLRSDALHEIIRGPFEKFPGHFEKELSAELAKELEAAIQERSESDLLNLSEVQITCLRLWESENPQREFRDKGIQGLLEGYLAETLAELPEILRDPAVALLSRMVTDAGLRNVVSQEDLIGRVSQEDQIGLDRLRAALAALEKQSRLIRRQRRHDVVFFEIISEFLVPWIAGQRAERKAKAEEEKAKAALRRKLLAVAVVLLAVAAFALGYAWWVDYTTTLEARQTELVQDEERKRKIAERDRVTAQSARDSLSAILETVRGERDNLITELEMVRGKRDKLITELGTVRGERGKLITELGTVRGERGKLIIELGTVRSNRDYFLNELVDAFAEIDQLKRQLAKQLMLPNGVSIEFVQIEPGEYLMGSENGEEDEKPAHRVRITRAFQLGKYEVTQEQWNAVMGDNPSEYKGARHPVENVSWDRVQEFIGKLNQRNDGFEYRLPTEAEWEYAARAGTTGKYAGDLDELAWYGDNSGSLRIDAAGILSTGGSQYLKIIQANKNRPHPVGGKKPNAWGLYDLHGNVLEWVQDWYIEDYYDTRPKPDIDPQGPNSGSGRVVRGGGWYAPAQDCRSAFRDMGRPGDRNGILGFRLLRQTR